MKNTNLKILDSFDIKLIAFVTMIIDHLGYFFYYLLNDDVYIMLRMIGRISMPLFAFLIYQGFKYTSNLRKYLNRLFLLSIITQIVVVIIGVFSYKIIPEYAIDFYKKINVVFSFFLSLIFIKMLDNLIKRENKTDTFFYFVASIAIVALYFVLDIEYGLLVLLLITLLYIYDSQVKKKIKSTILKIITAGVFIVIYFLYTIFTGEILNVFSLFAIVFILLYNGKKGNNTKRVFYWLYVIQYIAMYIIGGIIYYIYFV